MLIAVLKTLPPSKNVPTVGAVCMFDAMDVLSVTQLLYLILYKPRISKNTKMRQDTVKVEN
jgi:hypothetical protein